MNDKQKDQASSADAEKAPAQAPTKERKGVKRMKMTPRKGGTVTIKGKGNAKVS